MASIWLAFHDIASFNVQGCGNDKVVCATSLSLIKSNQVSAATFPNSASINRSVVSSLNGYVMKGKNN